MSQLKKYFDNAKLMEHIWTMDLEEAQKSCKDILNIAEVENNLYECALANLYLFYYYLTQKDYGSGRFYMLHAQTLCQENGLEDLLVIFHRIAGRYEQDMYDEQAAFRHYLQGMDIAKKIEDPVEESRLLNNIGTCFRHRHDNVSAAAYFYLAYEKLQPHISPENIENALCFLCNYAEANQYMKQDVKSEKALKEAESLDTRSRYCEFRLAYAWCGHYALVGDSERSITLANEFLADDFARFNNVHFKTEAYMELCSYMLDVNCRELALRFLKRLEACCCFDNSADYYSCQILKTRYFERFGTDEECNEAYREFYESRKKINQTDDFMRVHHVLSRLELTQAQLNRDAMRRENMELQNASYIDELTKLYNRRYLSRQLEQIAMMGADVRLGCVILDVDYFKQYNDFYGHFKGDSALQHVGSLLKQQVMEGVWAVRYGGDEFLVLFANRSDQQIEEYICKIQRDLASDNIPHEKSMCNDRLTLSIGYSSGKTGGVNIFEQLFKCADQALYMAKEKGRDCFVKWESVN